MNGRVSRHSDFLKRVLKQSKVIRKATKTQLAILIELALNIAHLSFTRKEESLLKKRLAALRDLARIRSARIARKVLPICDLLPTLVKAALQS